MTTSKKVLLLSLFLITITASLSAQDFQQRRGFMFGGYLSWARPTYNHPLGTALDLIESDPYIDRLRVGLGIELGYAVFQNIYVIIGVDGVGDRLFDSMDWIQENSYLYYTGVKVYPFHTGLNFEAKIGVSLLADTSNMYTTEFTEPGYGVGGTIGYDFGRRSRGFSAEIGVGYNYLGGMYPTGSTEEITISQFQIYGKLLIK